MTEITYLIDEVPVTASGLEGFSRKDAERCLEDLKAEEMLPIKKVKLTPAQDGKIAVDYDLIQPKFERIRRITGYLVGSLDRWNDSKKAEESERVKHELCKKSAD